MKLLLYSAFILLMLDFTFAKGGFTKKHKKKHALAKGIMLRRNCSKVKFFEERDITEELDAKVQLFVAAWSKRDWSLMEQVYTHDIICMAQGEATAIGLEELVELYERQSKSADRFILTTYKAVQMSSTRAYHIDLGTVFDKDGNVLVQNNRGVGVWRKEGDEWKIHIELVNNH